MAEDKSTISRTDWELYAAQVAYSRLVEQNRRQAQEKKSDDDRYNDDITALAVYEEVKYFLHFIGFLEKIRNDAHLLHEQVALKNSDTQKLRDQTDHYLQQIQKAASPVPLTKNEINTFISHIDALIKKTETETIANWGSKDWQTGLDQQVNKLVDKLPNPFDNLNIPKDIDPSVKTRMAAETITMKNELREKLADTKQPDQVMKIVQASLDAAVPTAPPIHLGGEAPVAPPLIISALQNVRQVAAKAITDTELKIATSASNLYKKFGDIVNPHGKHQFIRMGADFAKGAVGAIKELHHKVDQFCENKTIINNLSHARDQLRGLTNHLEKSLESKAHLTLRR